MEEGTILKNRYRLERLLGRGGMADVYLAFDTRRQAHVALKMLREDLAEDPEFVRRFRREAEALARLDHPNIVRFYGFEQAYPQAWIVMDYVPGTTLRRRLGEVGGSLPLDEITRIVRQVGAALSYAHAEGIVHRDLKPANIMLKPDDTALLSDFGIARAAEAMTMTAGPVGTPAYMAPEQILGQPVDGRADVYGLGAVLWEMVAGRRLFSGETGQGTTTAERVRDEHLHAAPADPCRLNPALSAAAGQVILRGLAKEPGQRFSDVVSFVRAWEDALRLPHEQVGVGIQAQPQPAAGQTTPPPGSDAAVVLAPSASRRRVWVAVGGVAALSVVVLLLLRLALGGGSGGSEPSKAGPLPASLTPATPLGPTPDIEGTAVAMARRIGTETAQARGTMEAMVATHAAATAHAAGETATAAARLTSTAERATATVQALETARAVATAARQTQEARDRLVTSTAETQARATGAAQAAAATAVAATRSALATAQAQANAAATAQAATAQARCRTDPDRLFAGAWNTAEVKSRIGCPAGAASVTQAALGPFERGVMIWRSDLRTIYAIFGDGGWRSYRDTWQEGDATYSCPNLAPSTSPPTPVRGFGRVWCQQAEVRNRLGSITQVEWGENMTAQAFERGIMITTSRGLYVLFNDGGWLSG